jgi:hypothetical protein
MPAKTLRRLAALALAAAGPLLQGGLDPAANLDDRLLAAHNRERTALGIAPLAWDAALARNADAYARQLVATGQFRHYRSGPEPDAQGENLWMGTAGYFAPETMISYWTAEKRNFKPGIFPDIAIRGDWAQVGHYSQMMWRSTGTVGCAIAGGGGRDILVCRYREAGNVFGERPF